MQLTQSQIKAYENGATMFIVPIDEKCIIMHNGHDNGEYNEDEEHYLEFPNSLIQKGDKNILVTESLINYDELQKSKEFTIFEPFYISECIDVRVVRVEGILDTEFIKLGYTKVKEKPMSTIRQFNKDHGFKWDDNDYIFLIEVRR